MSSYGGSLQSSSRAVTLEGMTSNGRVAFLLDGWVRVHYENATSTMDVARSLLQNGSFALPFVVSADSQSDGRGRQGAEWRSETGNLMATFAIELKAELKQCEGLSLVVGLAVRQVCMSLGVDIKLKWPNDLLVVIASKEQGLSSVSVKKVGGILVELLQRDGRVVALIGLGLNVASSPAGVFHGGHLNEVLVPGIDSDRALFGIIPVLTSYLAQFELEGFSSLRLQWLESAYGLQQEVTIQGDGECSGLVNGIMRGVTTRGALDVETLAGRQAIFGGHILRLGDFSSECK